MVAVDLCDQWPGLKGFGAGSNFIGLGWGRFGLVRTEFRHFN